MNVWFFFLTWQKWVSNLFVLMLWQHLYWSIMKFKIWMVVNSRCKQDLRVRTCPERTAADWWISMRWGGSLGLVSVVQTSFPHWLHVYVIDDCHIALSFYQLASLNCYLPFVIPSKASISFSLSPHGMGRLETVWREMESNAIKHPANFWEINNHQEWLWHMFSVKWLCGDLLRLWIWDLNAG